LDKLGICLDLRPHTHDCFPKYSGPGGERSEGDTNDDEAWEDEDDTANEGLHSQSFGGRHPDVRKIVIVSSTGIFKRDVRWCSCPNTPEKHIQLLRSRLFPATFAQPKTAFTLEVLDHFRLDALECNTSALNFMSKLTRKTNEVFPENIPVCIHRPHPDSSVSSCVGLCRITIGTSFGSRGSGGISIIACVQAKPTTVDQATVFVPGALAIFYPACPQLGINIPTEREWKQDELFVKHSIQWITPIKCFFTDGYIILRWLLMVI
jgi:hypothetical protein